MTRDQFRTWYRDYTEAFPETAAFMNKLDREKLKAAGDRWITILEPHSFADCMEATRMMQDGRAEPVKRFELELTPQRVAAVCMGLIRERGRMTPLDLAKQDRARYEAEVKAGLLKPVPLAKAARILARDKASGGDMGYAKAVELASDPNYVEPAEETKSESVA